MANRHIHCVCFEMQSVREMCNYIFFFFFVKFSAWSCPYYNFLFLEHVITPLIIIIVSLPNNFFLLFALILVYFIYLFFLRLFTIKFKIESEDKERSLMRVSFWSGFVFIAVFTFLFFCFIVFFKIWKKIIIKRRNGSKFIEINHFSFWFTKNYEYPKKKENAAILPPYIMLQWKQARVEELVILVHTEHKMALKPKLKITITKVIK